MASIIRVKRSTGTIAPASLNFGELGLTVGVGTHGNGGGRLFVGDFSNNSLIVGGRYYTDLLGIAPGLVAGQTNPTTPANGFVAILDQNRKVDQWNVDNIRIDGNIISSTNTDGHINLDPDGTGEIIIPDDTFLTFGTSQDSKIEYDENGTDKLTFTGADIRINIDTQSTDKDTGALIIEGGVGIEKNLFVGGNFSLTGVTTISGTTESTNKDTGCLVLEGGLGVEKNLNIGGVMAISGTTESTNKDTGCLVLEGGLGVEKNVNLGGNLGVTGNATINGNTTFGDASTDVTTITGRLDVDNLRLDGNTFSSTTGDITIDSAGGTVSISDNTAITGALTVTGDITAFFTSDQRLKDNVKPIDDPLSKVLSISGNTYNWNEKSNKEGNDVGVIAQEVEKILPEAVITRDNGYLAVDYHKIVPLLIEAIKELSQKVSDLENKLNK